MFNNEPEEHFFNQHKDIIPAEEVITAIDFNTSKLKRSEPKFYSLTVSPSKYELEKLKNNSLDLKRYTRELMKDYAASFNRDQEIKEITMADVPEIEQEYRTCGKYNIQH